MKLELEKQLKTEFPQIMIDLHEANPKESCMAWGIECDDGWYDLIHKLCSDIQAFNPPELFKAVQIKSKWGGLRFYVNEATEDIYKLISDAEEQSYKVCEYCGSLDGTKPSGCSWILTLCSKCRA